MLALMILGVSTSAVLAAGAWASSALLRRSGRQTRALWLGALALMLGTVVVAPLRTADVAAAGATGVASIPRFVVRGAADLSPMVTAVARALPARTDDALAVLWAISAGSALLLLLAGLRRQQVLLRATRPAQLHGTALRVSDNFGPAVVGILRPEIVVPEWLLSRSLEEQRLVLAHERAHIAGHDTRWLALGVVFVLPLAWNPIAWWCLARLRLASELDCDARVLASGVSRGAYGSVLLDLAAYATPQFGVAGFAAHPTQLERRVRAMTERPISPARRTWALTAAVLVTISAIVTACSASTNSPLSPAPRPDATTAQARQAPSETETEVPLPRQAETETKIRALHEYEVQVPARPTPGTVNIKYPQSLRDAGVTGQVMVQFIVGVDGVVDQSTVKIVQSDHPLFEESVRAGLREIRFAPAQKDGKPAPQLIQQPFVFALDR